MLLVITILFILMAVTILEALQNAHYNLANDVVTFQRQLGLEQLSNAIQLLENGYKINDDVESNLDKGPRTIKYDKLLDNLELSNEHKESLEKIFKSLKLNKVLLSQMSDDDQRSYLEEPPQYFEEWFVAAAISFIRGGHF